MVTTRQHVLCVSKPKETPLVHFFIFVNKYCEIFFRVKLNCFLQIFYGDDRGNIESLELNTSKTFVCKFPNCNKPFATTHYLLKHLFVYHFNLMKHQANTRFKCEWSGCDKWYDSNQLKAHIIGHFEFI
jgi:hypothetical protein